MAKKRGHLGEILYKAGKVDKQPLLAAIKESKAGNKKLGQVLLEKGLVNEETLNLCSRFRGDVTSSELLPDRSRI